MADCKYNSQIEFSNGGIYKQMRKGGLEKASVS